MPMKPLTRSQLLALSDLFHVESFDEEWWRLHCTVSMDSCNTLTIVVTDVDEQDVAELYPNDPPFSDR